MNRKIIVNSLAGSVIGYATVILISEGYLVLGIGTLVAWVVGIVNSLIP